MRLEARDEIAFEQQRLDLALGRHHLDAGSAGDHALKTPRQRRRVDVAGDPFLEVFRFADIERLARRIEHTVDTGALRHDRDRLAQRP